MRFPRRNFLQLAAGIGAVPITSLIASALDYPTRPVHLVVGFPAGAAPDVVGRLISDWLSRQFGQQFVVDNRPGAASNIGTEIVVKAPSDGYTLLLAVSTNAVNVSIYKNLNFNFIRDLAPVASIGSTPFVMLSNPEFPAKSFPEFVAYAKAHPGKINMASQGIGTTPHVCGELLKMMTGINFVHVPYRGNLLPDLLAGQVQFSFLPVAPTIGYIRDRRLRALAVTTAKRATLLPDVPAIAEFVPGYVASGWFGICAPAGTPDDIVDMVGRRVLAGIADVSVKGRLLALGVEPMPMMSCEFGKFIADETAKWGKVIKFAGIKPESQ